ncbi:L-serine ammonia-lyase [Pseudonocardia sp. N23]|uniref:L-serine ammonia-lyase n=1 Tax=Pseudonocardia sp. N23 TaxID=1987376 RepID=UPI000BFD7A8B|nr:L-serine ammonia-lyase [Pseudonocardia sp. N23]GAY10996.1 L-serine dehydratase [Pseudonocardia sp. N23]
MSPSVLDLYSIGIGPSSSHTVGPMRAAVEFAREVADSPGRVEQVRVELFGSLGATGPGHGTPNAVVLGLLGHDPARVDTDVGRRAIDRVRSERRVALAGTADVAFDPATDMVLHRHALAAHPNGMRFAAVDGAGRLVRTRVFYSVGGGFVVEAAEDGSLPPEPEPAPAPHPFDTAAELVAQCKAQRVGVAELMLRNETASRPRADVEAGLRTVWAAMQECVRRGMTTDGTLPGGLEVRRRAPGLLRSLTDRERTGATADRIDWAALFALAVNEENAAGGRVVTAPTNGAAGIIPAVLHTYMRFTPGASDADAVRFLLAGGAIGLLVKRHASISGAEMGCQGEVGSACAMAAAGLCEVLGGTPAQVENAAEIGIEHNLGLTCDPVGGLVQIPCIERNAVAAVKAISAAQLALHGDGSHRVSLDQVIATLRQTGEDMRSEYKETSRGGLAVNVVAC